MEQALASSQLLAPNKCLLQRHAVPQLRRIAAHKRTQCNAERYDITFNSVHPPFGMASVLLQWVLHDLRSASSSADAFSFPRCTALD